MVEKRTHFSALIAWRWKDKKLGVREYLVIPIKEDHLNSPAAAANMSIELRAATLEKVLPQIKFPGGMGAEEKPDETPIDTTRREFEEETGLRLMGVNSRFKYEKPKGPLHTKYFFLTGPNDDPADPDWEGNLRSEPKIEKEQGRPDEILLVPVWKTYRELMPVIFMTHLPALKWAEEFLDKYGR